MGYSLVGDWKKYLDGYNPPAPKPPAENKTALEMIAEEWGAGTSFWPDLWGVKSPAWTDEDSEKAAQGSNPYIAEPGKVVTHAAAGSPVLIYVIVGLFALLILKD